MANFSAKDPITKLKALYLHAKDMYYNDPNGRTLMSDDEFDELEDVIREREPKWEGLKATGVGTKNKKVKVKLFVPMPSLDKVKADTVDKWLGNVRSPYVVLSDKLDGSSLQLKYIDGVPRHLITRGDGVIGGDISFLIPHLKVPQKVGTATFTVRCEGLFSKSAFLKYKAEFDAARNAASGIFNRQDVHRATKDLSIMVLKVLEPSVKPSQGLAWAKAKGFTVVPFKVVPTKKLNAINLTKLLEKRKAMSKYHLDGLVIEEDKVNKVTKDKPDWAKAFKNNITAESAPVTTVRKVHWDISSRAQIIPRIEFDAVEFDGAQVRFASAFNAKYVNQNGIGIGAKVAILRSGDIIPYIAKIVKPAKPSKPDVREVGDYVMDKRGTNYVLSKPADSDEFRIQRLLKFFNTLDVDFIRIGTVRKMYAEGFTNVKKWISATPTKLMAAGLTEATATKLYDSLQKAVGKGVPLVKLMDASSVFPHGMGETRFEKIAEHYDLEKILEMSPDEQEKALSTISGFGPSVIGAFISGAPKFQKWRAAVGIQVVKERKAKVKLKSAALNSIGVTWTGYRDKEQEQIVVENGGSVVPFGGKTSILLVSPSGKASSKADKAEQKGIPVMVWDKFVRKYGL